MTAACLEKLQAVVYLWISISSAAFGGSRNGGGGLEAVELGSWVELRCNQAESMAAHACTCGITHAMAAKPKVRPEVPSLSGGTPADESSRLSTRAVESLYRGGGAGGSSATSRHARPNSILLFSFRLSIPDLKHQLMATILSNPLTRTTRAVAEHRKYVGWLALSSGRDIALVSLIPAFQRSPRRSCIQCKYSVSTYMLPVARCRPQLWRWGLGYFSEGKLKQRLLNFAHNLVISRSNGELCCDGGIRGIQSI